MTEEWRDVVGYEGLYQVSNTGKVRSMNYMRRGQVRELSQAECNGYRTLCLSKEKKQKNFYVHILVAEAFIGKRPEGYEVNHINLDRGMNNLKNLEYVTRSDNHYHRAAFSTPIRYRESAIEYACHYLEKELAKNSDQQDKVTVQYFQKRIAYLRVAIELEKQNGS